MSRCTSRSLRERARAPTRYCANGRIAGRTRIEAQATDPMQLSEFGSCAYVKRSARQWRNVLQRRCMLARSLIEQVAGPQEQQHAARSHRHSIAGVGIDEHEAVGGQLVLRNLILLVVVVALQTGMELVKVIVQSCSEAQWRHLRQIATAIQLTTHIVRGESQLEMLPALLQQREIDFSFESVELRAVLADDEHRKIIFDIAGCALEDV